MVTEKGIRQADEMDLMGFTVHELRLLARAHKAGSGVWINSANKINLIKALLKKKVTLTQLSHKSAQAEIMDTVPEKVINDEVIAMFRRLIMIMSEETFREYKRKIEEDRS